MSDATEMTRRLIEQGVRDADQGNGIMGVLSDLELEAVGMPYGPRDAEEEDVFRNGELHRGLSGGAWYRIGFALGVIVDAIEKLEGLRIDLSEAKAVISIARPGELMTEAITISPETDDEAYNLEVH